MRYFVGNILSPQFEDGVTVTAHLYLGLVYGKCGADMRMFERVKCSKILRKLKTLVDRLGSEVRVVPVFKCSLFRILHVRTSTHQHNNTPGPWVP